MKLQREIVTAVGGLALVSVLFSPHTFAQSQLNTKTNSAVNTTADDQEALDKKGTPAVMPDITKPRIVSVTPSYGPTDTQVVIRANVRLDKATEVIWGGHGTKTFSVQGDGTIITNVPIYGFPGASTVPVTVRLDHTLVPTDSTFTIPVGYVEVPLPSPFVPITIDNSDTYWLNGGGRDGEIGPGGTILSGTPNPVLYVAISVPNSGLKYSPEKIPLAAGNQASFQAALQMCEVRKDVHDLPPGTACKNWDGYQGVWVQVNEKCQPEPPTIKDSLTYPMMQPHILDWIPGKTNSSRIAIDLSPCFDKNNLVRTFQYYLRVQQIQNGVAAGFPTDRNALITSPSFNVVIPPAALLEASVIPYTILFQPPGDQSKVSFSAQKTYSTQFSIADSTSIDNKSSTTESSSTDFAASLSFFLGISGGSKEQDTQTTMKDFGTVQGSGPQGMSSAAFTSSFSTAPNTTEVPGSGAICVATTTSKCSSTTPTPNLYALEPFWNDQFVLIIHPQFEVWVIGGKPDRYVMYGAVPVLGEISVAELDACANGTTLSWGVIDPCTITYTDAYPTSADALTIVDRARKEKVKLSPADARHLLALDPFYEKGQGADIEVTRASLIASVTYGAMAGQVDLPYTRTLANTDQQETNKNSQTSYTTDITATSANTTSAGLSLNISPGGGGGDGGGSNPTVGVKESLTIESQDQTSGETDTKLTYQNSTAVSDQKVTTASVTLDDNATCNGCHGPLESRPSANIYFDRAFGGFMFQDAYAPKDYSRDKAPKCCVMLANALIQREIVHPRFSDVTESGRELGVIGLLALAGVLPGNADGMFKPNEPFTREDLAVALARAAHLPEKTPAGRFSDIQADHAGLIEAAVAAGFVVPRSASQFGSSDQITGADLTKSLAKAGLAPTQGTASVQPTGALTRADAARLIFQAFKDR